MRQRKVKNLDEKLNSVSAYAVDDPAASRGRWKEVFGNDRPLRCELGSGKGRFLTEMAKAHPDINFIGAEGQLSVVLKALEKAQEAGLANVRFITGYVNDMDAVFAPGEIEAVYLNFSDPWPKDRHAKRRLTHRARLAKYMEALCPGGTIEFRTDNDALFDFSLEEAEALGLRVAEVSRDFVSDISTEYELKFREAGVKINRLLIIKE